MSKLAEFAVSLRPQLAILHNGERLEVIVDGHKNLPLFNETMFVLETHRTRHNATTTIRNCNTSLRAMHMALAVLDIDLEKRLAAATPLRSHELIAIARLLRQPMDSLRAQLGQKRPPLSAPRITSLEGVRLKLPIAHAERRSLVRALADTRLREFVGFLEWRYLWQQETAPRSSAIFAGALERLARFKSLHKHFRSPSSIGQREGLDEETLETLFRIIEPATVGNPWRNPICQLRNELIILFGLLLGLRIGEILGLRISDLNLVLRRITVRRRADDVDDPRRDQPNAKTADRILAMSESLTRKIEDYIICRSSIRGTAQYDFLFVSVHGGRPLSKSASQKLYQVLRAKVPDLPDDLSSHVTRHTYNDQLSDLFDANRVTEGQEVKLRNYLNGWSDRSKSAETYTRRHTRRKANEVSLELQRLSLPRECE